jgi:hypothetical protein
MQNLQQKRSNKHRSEKALARAQGWLCLATRSPKHLPAAGRQWLRVYIGDQY